jgi:dGTPase
LGVNVNRHGAMGIKRMAELASFAADPRQSRGRLYEEAACPTRDLYQRDRDRIVHSTAFRRLIHKTQVFIYHEGDHYRTRLTHSLEVAQIARTIARALRLNEDLVETISLAHDLGHTPFGHAGEDALDEAMKPVGGFDHNAQSLRIVTFLEHRYAAFRGLNLTWETLEGIVKHNGPLTGSEGQPLARYARKGLPHAIRAYMHLQDLRLGTFPSLEGQIAALADDIAYNNHDIDDGFRAGYIKLKELEEVPMAGRILALVRARHGDLPEGPLVYEMNRRMITSMVEDVLAETTARIADANPSSIEDVRLLPSPLAEFSEKMAADIAGLRRFLFARVYKHPAIDAKMQHAKAVVADLYRFYSEHPTAIQGEGAKAAEIEDLIDRQRIIGDFVAGMTDRFALQSHAALFGNGPH